jgi:hypothetical protein
MLAQSRTEPGFAEELADPSDLRLAFNSNDRQVYIARGKRPGTVGVWAISPFHSAAACGVMPDLATTGAWFMRGSSSHEPGYVITGVVPDAVMSVHVGSTEATMGENVFVARVSSLDDPVVVTTDAGTKTVELPPRMP